MKKKIPKFNNEDEEREFWSKNDSSEYLNWKNAKVITSPDFEEFNTLIQQTRKQAKAAGLKQKEVSAAVAKVRKHK